VAQLQLFNEVRDVSNYLPTYPRREALTNMTAKQLEGKLRAWANPPAVVPAAAAINPEHALNFFCENPECPRNKKSFSALQKLKAHKCRM